MKILNIHEREISASADDVAALVAGLGSPDDKLWPKENWPRMILDKPLAKGARGGHGPIRYHVGEYVPGSHVTFQFDDEGLVRDMKGFHRFEIESRGNGTILRHIVDATCNLKMWLTWHMMVGPMHDAVLEDAFDQAERFFGEEPKKPARWSLWVRLMRRRVQKLRKKMEQT